MKRSAFAVLGTLGALGLAAGLSLAACGNGFPSLFVGNATRDAGAVDDDAGKIPSLTGGCIGYGCTAASSCPNSVVTTVTGTVYDPAGLDPLYNVVVYVPAKQPGPITTGATCDSCDSLYSGGAVSSAVTNASGEFALKNVPSGTNIPLVIQIGKWRKQTVIPTVKACTNNPIPGKLTLPSRESEGDIPNIAVSTGGADSLECLFLRIGIDASEYVAGNGTPGRIHIFQGSNSTAPGSLSAATTSPPAPLSSIALWNSTSNLMPYDITILSCEGSETVDQPGGGAITADDQEHLLEYTSAGGRVFASHFHYAWFDNGPFGAENIAQWTRGANPITDSTNNPVLNGNGDFINADIVTSFFDGGTFPKGEIMQEWLTNVQALNAIGEAAPGELHIDGAKHNADLVGVAGSPSQEWIAADQSAQTEVIYDEPDAGPVLSAAGAVEYLSFNTPVDASVDDAGSPAYCGRVVYSDLHVGAASGDYGGSGAGGIVPSECALNPLSPQEKALEFMLFDLSSCVTPDTSSGQQPTPGPLQ